MPVFWFAVSFVNQVNIPNTILAFFIIHFLLYPASNGYNSYMDRDTTPVGGIERPMQPTKQLFVITIILDITAFLLSLGLSPIFAACLVFYIICSRLYSYRGIRLKRFPIMGYVTVVCNQGCLIFFMVYHAAESSYTPIFPISAMIAAGFLIGGFYPITQIYQHQSDAEDKVKTISMMLGKKGTFIFCAGMYGIAFVLLFFSYSNHLQYFMVIQLFFLPVIFYFIYWLNRVWKYEEQANFKHTMRMNWLASTCSNLAFITILIIHQIG